MTNLEKYHKVLKDNFRLKDDGAYDDENLVYNKHPHWKSLSHMEMSTELEAVFGINFETLDILRFNTYTNGLKILRKLGVDV